IEIEARAAAVSELKNSPTPSPYSPNISPTPSMIPRQAHQRQVSVASAPVMIPARITAPAASPANPTPERGVVAAYSLVRSGVIASWRPHPCFASVAASDVIELIATAVP